MNKPRCFTTPIALPFFVVVLALVLMGCDATTTPDLETTSPEFFTPVLSESARLAAIANQERAERIVYPFKTHDDLMLHIAERAPSFGGVYTDEDLRPHIYLKDPNDKEAAARVIDELTVADHMTGAYRTIFAYYGKAKAMSSMVVHKADYSISELAAMREQLHAQNLPGIGGIGIAEDKNRLSITLEDGFSEQAVRASVRNTNILEQALLFYEQRSVKDLVTLQDRVRPAAGGLKIVRGTGSCTLGFPTYTESGKEGFVTASHCTSNMGQDNNDQFYQNQNGVSADLIGTEEVDPPFGQIGGSSCPSFATGCRYSDAAFFKEQGYTAIQQHLVVPTTYVTDNTITGNFAKPGSLIISTLNTGSWLQYAGRVYYGTINTPVDKIGATTGWTRATLKSTSDPATESITQPGLYILDPDWVEKGYALEGDSGSIVFYKTGSNDILLHGILFQGNQSGWYYYSPIRHVQSELLLLFS